MSLNSKEGANDIVYLFDLQLRPTFSFPSLCTFCEILQFGSEVPKHSKNVGLFVSLCQSHIPNYRFFSHTDWNSFQRHVPSSPTVLLQSSRTYIVVILKARICIGCNVSWFTKRLRYIKSSISAILRNRTIISQTWLLTMMLNFSGNLCIRCEQYLLSTDQQRQLIINYRYCDKIT